MIIDNEMVSFLLFAVVSAFTTYFVSFKLVLYFVCMMAYTPYHDRSFQVLSYVASYLVYIASLIAVVAIPMAIGATCVCMWTLIHLIIFEANGVFFLVLHCLMFHVDVILFIMIPSTIVSWLNEVHRCIYDVPPIY